MNWPLWANPLPIDCSAFPAPHGGPHNLQLDTTRFRTAFGLGLPFRQQGVMRMLQEIL